MGFISNRLIHNAEIMTMGGTRQLELELDGQELVQVEEFVFHANVNIRKQRQHIRA